MHMFTTWRHTVIVSFCALLMLSPVVLAQTPDNLEAGIIKTAKGQVTVIRNAEKLPASAGLSLHSGDEIQTGSDSSVGMTFIDGTRVSLGAISRFSVDKYVFSTKDHRYAFKMHMQKGTMAYSSGKLAKIAPESIAIQTPQSTVGVRGTKLLIKVD